VGNGYECTWRNGAWKSRRGGEAANRRQTGEILTLCRRNTGKPVIAVPCCVFPSLFPDRRFADGYLCAHRHASCLRFPFYFPLQSLFCPLLARFCVQPSCSFSMHRTEVFTAGARWCLGLNLWSICANTTSWNMSESTPLAAPTLRATLCVPVHRQPASPAHTSPTPCLLRAQQPYR